MRIERYAVAHWWQVGLAVYMQLVSWIPLGRWNYQPCCPTGLEQMRRGTLSAGDALGLAAFALIPLLSWWGYRTGRRFALKLALGSCVVWLGLQLGTWWLPYLFGATDHWSRVYQRAFAHSTPILPSWGNHLPPDAMHLVLQVLLMGVVISGFSALVRPPPDTHHTIL